MLAAKKQGGVMQVQGLDHVVLRVADTQRSARFYAKLLGCEVERVVDEIGLVQLRAGASLIDLLPVDRATDDVSNYPNMDHFCLLVVPFNAELIAQRCKALGVNYEDTQRRYGATGYGPSIYLRDPDGNGVELKGRDDP